jgi:hypothetical protein
MLLTAGTLLAGLGLVGVALYARQRTRTDPPPQAKPIEILVTRSGVFQGRTLKAGDVRLRPATPQEWQHDEAQRDRYLTSLPEAADRRVLARSLEPDRPVLHDDLEEAAVPDVLRRRLLSGLCLVEVALRAEQAADGLAAFGDHVDVYFSPRAAAPAAGTCIARGVRVVDRRKRLWPGLPGPAEERPVRLMLAVELSRRNLIESAQQAGDLTVTPAGAVCLPV